MGEVGKGTQQWVLGKRCETARRIADLRLPIDPSLPSLPIGLLGKANERVIPCVFTDDQMCPLIP
jgi:hypothetical protein